MSIDVEPRVSWRQFWIRCVLEEDPTSH